MLGDLVPSEREIIFKRVFDASPEVVWNAWTQADQLTKWWGPKDCKVIIQELDFKPGGQWRFIIATPEGREFQNKIYYETIKYQQHLHFLYTGSLFGAIQFRAAVNFAPLGFQAEIVIRLLFKTAQERNEAVVEQNIVQMYNQSLDRLNTLLSEKFQKLFNKG
jgi:hypothetical protein